MIKNIVVIRNLINKFIAVEAAPLQIIGFIKLEIWRKHQIPIGNQVLCSKGLCLNNYFTLKQYNMVDRFMEVWLIGKDAKFVIVD